MFISMWITIPAFGWGALGHRVIAEYGTALADPKALSNCRITSTQLVAHTNDPDILWRNQRFKFPHEAQMHFFHVERQPKNWRSRNEAADTSQGRLIYHVVDWASEAKKFRKQGKWDTLAERLYGLSHYVGDLTQPLHLHHDYDGDEAGIPDIHSQWETKMLNRFEQQIRAGVKARLSAEKIPDLWREFDLRHLIFDTAGQSNVKATRLLAQAREALIIPKSSQRRKSNKIPRPRFVKTELWRATGELALDQLALGARLWAFTLNEICR